MGAFQVTVEVAGPDRDRFVTVDALVDAGSTYSVLPSSLLAELGVTVEDTARFRSRDA